MKGAADGAPHPGLQLRRQPAKQAVRKGNDVRGDFGLDETHELLNLLALKSFIAAKHRDGHVTQMGRIHPEAPVRRQFEDRLEVPKPVQDPGSLAKDAEVLLEIDIDSAQEDPSLADVGFIGASGGVGRNQMDLMTSGHERRRQGIVPETAAAVHGAGARGNERNLQWSTE